MFRRTAEAVLIWTAEEPRRAGWTYGTLEGYPECGEEAFVVDRTGDGTVWLTVSAFSPRCADPPLCRSEDSSAHHFEAAKCHGSTRTHSLHGVADREGVKRGAGRHKVSDFSDRVRERVMEILGTP
ncbi:hypothetical protein Srubr_50810 [Streptomyces rubradiris]|uniref:DUF1990 domain-containing protein n=1 Tax=Streptomyces rubradiris TaxID=285531 RepID=A0ABQ3RHA4_STRRR|nr:hypothetical protein GCM10018792_79030 [Streptomyces rubradiris]GHI55235.1 hypothetical protein Srubr_50810 [Streptomyces rubradiris]